MKKLKTIEIKYNKQGKKESEVHITINPDSKSLSTEKYNITYINDTTYSKVHSYDETHYVTIVENSNGDINAFSSKDSMKYYSYNEGGKLVEISEKSDKGEIIIRNYYEHGRLIESKVRTFDIDGTLLNVDEYQVTYFGNTLIYHDHNMVLIKIITLDSEGRTESEILKDTINKYDYDRRGRLIRTEIYLKQ